MVDTNAFLATILEHPDDDAPRLVFADWLEEQGATDRAEFIRVQMELAHPPVADARRALLLQRQESLLLQHRKEWLQPLFERLEAVRAEQGNQPGPNLFALFSSMMGTRTSPFFAGGIATDEGAGQPRESLEMFLTQLLQPLQVHLPIPSLVDCRFRRGFVEAAAMMAGDFVRFAEPLFELVPLREVLANNGPFQRGILDQRGFEDLFACPHLQRLSGLRLKGLLADAQLDAFLGSPFLRKLQLLDLSQVITPMQQCERLLSAQNLPALRELNLSTKPLGNFHVTILSMNENWKHLQSLNLAQTGLGDEGLQALAATRALGNLAQVNLSHNQITPAGVLHLARSPLANQLQELDLAHNRLSESMVETFWRWPARIRGKRTPCPWVQQFLDSPMAGRLQRLNLGGNLLAREDRLALQERFGPGLTWDN
jgi:uncharacterized protein (TIGR02996 family)